MVYGVLELKGPMAVGLNDRLRRSFSRRGGGTCVGQTLDRKYLMPPDHRSVQTAAEPIREDSGTAVAGFSLKGAATVVC